MMRSSLLSGHKRQFEESFYDCDDHLLSGNENVSSNLEELNNIITFHLESCKGPCNHDNTTDYNASYDSDDSSMYSSGENTSSIDLGADYKKRCCVKGANFHRSKRLKWLKNRLDELMWNWNLPRMRELKR